MPCRTDGQLGGLARSKGLIHSQPLANQPTVKFSGAASPAELGRIIIVKTFPSESLSTESTVSQVCFPRPAVNRPSLSAALIAVAIATAGWLGMQAVTAQEDENTVKSGYIIEVAAPLDGETSNQLLVQLKQLAESAPEGQRVTVVIRYTSTSESGGETTFEDALKVARAMTQPQLRRIRVVSLLQGEISGHTALPILSSDKLLLFAGAALANATAGESASDETILVSYQSIAARRGLFPPAVVTALVDPEAELALVSKVGGDRVFATGPELKKLRDSGEVLREEILSAAGVPLRLDAKQLREARVAAGVVDSLDQAAELLDLADLNPVNETPGDGEAKGALLEIAGSVAPNRVRRWQSNLSATLESGEVNTWVISIDSGGGDINESATLAGWFSQPDPPLRTVAGLIRGEARGDAALIALACRPLYMKPGSSIGGPGGDSINDEDIERYDELIEQVARSTRRPAALIRGLLNRKMVVYRYTNRKTGRIRYATEDDLGREAEDVELERERWERGEQVDLSAGLTPPQAIELGLVDGESRSLEDTSRRVGLAGTPPQITDRKIVRFVEKLGRSPGLAFILLFIGFVTLSAEANAPGMSVPGFISIVCFGLYFWIKFLAGTAEWLELVLFALGLMCIALEIFVVPGFGIFGVGGLALTVMGIVLMSQTFVIPRNTYQIEVLTRGLWIAIGGAAGMVGGFVAMRMLFPHVPFLSGLVMEAPNAEVVHEAEKIADFADLAGQTGVTTTKLMPSGKARFGDKIVAVVSEGSAVSAGQTIRVIEVQGNRIVVEAVNT